MNSKQLDAAECGRILKQIAPVLEISIEKFEELFANECEHVIGGKGMYTSDTYHGFFNGRAWPFHEIGFYECLEIMNSILEKQTNFNERELEEKAKKISKIVHVAFSDWNNLTYHTSENDSEKSRQKKKEKGGKIQDGVKWLMLDVERLDIETIYVLNRYFESFASFDEDCHKCLDYIDEHNDAEGMIKMFSKDSIMLYGSTFFTAIKSKELSGWLELRNSRSKIRDAVRKMDNENIAKVKQSIQDKALKLELGDLVQLHNFIIYFNEKREGSFFNLKKAELDFLIFYKYWFRYNLNQQDA